MTFILELDLHGSMLVVLRILNPCHAEYVLFTRLLPNVYAVILQQSNYKHVIISRVENFVDPDQMASL